jgi:hypothetical protein
MSSENAQLSIAALFHGLLFAYQKATKDVLGSGCEVFVHPTLEILKEIDGKEGLHLFKNGSLDEAIGAFSNMLLEAKAVREFSFKKVGHEKYLLKIDGCIWARHIHEMLKPKDVTCPLALVVMAIFRKHIGDKVEESESKYLTEGTETEIKSFHKIHWREIDSLETAAPET